MNDMPLQAVSGRGRWKCLLPPLPILYRAAALLVVAVKRSLAWWRLGRGTIEVAVGVGEVGVDDDGALLITTAATRPIHSPTNMDKPAIVRMERRLVL